MSPVFGVQRVMGPEGIPTRDDWGDLKVDPEVASGYQLLGGKSREQALPFFLDNPLERAAELHFTPGPVFNYYVFCFVDHLLSPSSRGESDMASCFLRLVRERIQTQPKQLEEVWSQLRPAVVAVATRQAFYDADEAIYGSFATLADEIESAHNLGRGRDAEQGDAADKALP